MAVRNKVHELHKCKTAGRDNTLQMKGQHGSSYDRPKGNIIVSMCIVHVNRKINHHLKPSDIALK
jgi:hypothetical protein